MKWDQSCNSLTPTRNRFEQTHPSTCSKCHSLSLGISSWNNYLWLDALRAPNQLCFDLLVVAPMDLEEAQLPSLPKMQRNSSLGKVQPHCSSQTSHMPGMGPDVYWSPDHHPLHVFHPCATLQNPRWKWGMRCKSTMELLTERIRSVLSPFVMGIGIRQDLNTQIWARVVAAPGTKQRHNQSNVLQSIF